MGEAADGLSALNEARRLRPDLVLLDIQLPDISGFEVTRQLAAEGNGAAVVLISSRDASDYRRRLAGRFQPINPDEPQPAHKVKALTADEVRALRRAGLTDDQIDAVSLVGMGADEVNELMMRGIRPSDGKGRGR